MAEKKKQHYVPRFYLKFFSDDDKKSINLFNLKSQRHIKGGNLKNQCCEPYFYGEDLKIENAFGELEAVSSNAIHKIIEDQKAPKQFSEEHHLVLTFVLLQYARTKYSEESGNEFLDKFVKQIFSKDNRFNPEELEQVKVEFENSVSNQIKIMAQSIPLAMDLKCKLLINKTDLNFITSDNPVVFYNSACELIDFVSTTGLAYKGLKIFFPISPKELLLFYDSRIYKTGCKKQDFSEITEKLDIEQINDLQWHSALMNVYHDNNLPYAELQRGIRKNINKRNRPKANVNEYPGEVKGDGTETSLIHMHKPDIKTGLSLHCLKQIREVTEEEVCDGSKCVRDLGLIHLHRKFIKLVESGKYQMHQFGEYLIAES